MKRKVLALNKDQIEREPFMIPLPYRNRISKPFLFLPPGVRLLLDLAFCLHGTISSVDYSFVTPAKHMDWDETFVSH